jgi:hypothetical protein
MIPARTNAIRRPPRMNPTLFLQRWVFRVESCGVADVMERRYSSLSTGGIAMAYSYRGRGDPNPR